MNTSLKSSLMSLLLCGTVCLSFGQTSSISGKVGKGSVPKNCNISLKNTSTGVVLTQPLTTSNYIFENVPNGLYTISVAKDEEDDYLNGVTTLDIVLMQRHILALQIQTAPEVLIAADINNDAKITASDIIEARKLILGIINKFSNNTSWKFIRKPNGPVTNPWDLADQTINLQGNITDIDFLISKVGDLNGNAVY